MNGERMRIALTGTRGIPARYGGFETCAQELSVRLAKKGHDVWVYNRSGYYKQKPKEYQGVKLIYVPECKIKVLDTLSHTFLSLVHALWKQYDVILVLNNANSPLMILPKLWGKNAVLHIDGLEWQRGKWLGLGRIYFKFVEWLSMRLGIELITDSRCLQRYYQNKYKKKVHFIPYGAALQKSHQPEILSRYGLKPREYFLQVTRFEPENNPLLSMKAFLELDTDKKLVLVGGVRYSTDYAAEIFSIQDKRIKRPGFIYDPVVLRELLSNCYAYIHGNEVGGTNPGLLQAMGSGCFVICRDVPFNREVLQDAGIYFEKDVESLKEKISWALAHESQTQKFGEAAKQIINDHYDWDLVVEKYLQIFNSFHKAQRFFHMF
ncbi:MAG: DUF1972 domain-containing protein [Candidatus Aminicenantes bacterium]|nr:DUF1972 domain-containing protein [Candidatus Aminicenantes bacterium]